MEYQKNRHTTRLSGYDYSTPGAYFLTICTEKRKCLLSKIERPSILEEPKIDLLPHGEIAAKYINQLNTFYENMIIEGYVIMPNHIHILLRITDASSEHPSTIQNSIVSRFISTFKRFCNKEYGQNIWQRRSYDHIIRGDADFDEHLQYIYGNPFSWTKDEFYSEE